MSHDSHPHPHGDGSWIGRSVPRVEDDRLLRGNGRYVDDIALPAAVEAAFLRSPHAHARIDSVDVSAALAAPGVVAVWTGDDVADLPAMLNKEELRTPPGLAELLDPVVRMTPMPLLAADKVLYVGQPVAVVFAENRYLAEDALELVDVRYSPLAVLVDPERSLTPDAPLLHEELPDNTAVTVAARAGDPDTAFARAHAVVSERFEAHRYVASPIETRAISAQVDPYSEQADRLVGHPDPPPAARRHRPHPRPGARRRPRHRGRRRRRFRPEGHPLRRGTHRPPCRPPHRPPRAVARGPQREPHRLLPRP